MRTTARSNVRQPAAQNGNIPSYTNDIRDLHSSMMQINDKLNQILSSSASSSHLTGSISIFIRKIDL